MSSKGKRTRRSFSEEFKRDAVNLIVKEGYSIPAAAQAVNVDPGNLRLWFKKYAPEPDPCGPESTMDQVLEENKRLRKQLRQAELEKEILKKATAYFAKESQ